MEENRNRKPMYCILLTGIPAAGKSTMAEFLSEQLELPVISKDKIKEILFDELGFGSREEKVKLGVASMEIMYDMAEQLMTCRKPFILENNFETASKEGLMTRLNRYSYQAVTVTLTGDYSVIYQRFLARNESPDRHRGHVVNDCYPEKTPNHKVTPVSYEGFVAGITKRGMDTFTANGPQIVVDTTDFEKVQREEVLRQILAFRDKILLMR